MTHYDPFIKLTHLYTEAGAHRSSPLYLKPERVIDIANGHVFVEGGNYIVSEKADQIRDLVVAKLAENKQAETMGK